MTEPCTLHILHTNDVHSRFHHMPQIATCLKMNRSLWEARGEHVLTVDVGDHLDRMNIKTEASWGHTNVEVLNRSGYQYVTIGNNEGLTLPKERLDRLYDQANFTVVLGNFLNLSDDSQPSWAVPFAIHRFADLRIAIVGATADFSSVYKLIGWHSKEPISLLKQQVNHLRQQADVVIVLSHLGYQQDLKMAKEIEGIDVILGAHTHHLLESGERVGSTLIAQTGSFGKYVGHVKLELDRVSKQVVSRSAEVFAMKAYPADTELQAFLQQEEAGAEQLLSRPVARLPVELEINWEEESPFGSFLAASIRRWTGAEIGFANAGLLLSPLKKGDVTGKDLLDCVPHPLHTCTLTLTGAQLWQLLDRVIQPENVQRELRGFGFRGKVLGWMGVDGIRVEWQQSARPVLRQVEVAGEPLEPARRYLVATVDMFLYNRLFPELLDAPDVNLFLPEMLREIFAQMLQDEELIRTSFLPRWHRAPSTL